MLSIYIMPLIDPLVLTTWLASILYLLGALFTWRRREVHPGVTRLALTYSLVSMAWVIGQSLWKLGYFTFLRREFLAHLPYYGLFILAVLFLFLTRAFLRSGQDMRAWGLLACFWLGGLLLLDLNVFRLPEVLAFQSGRVVTLPRLIDALLVMGWGIYMAGATGLATHALRHIPHAYTSVSYWVLVLLLTVIGDGLYFNGNLEAGNLLRLAGTSLAVYVVCMPRLADIGLVLRHSLVYLASTLAAILIYTAGLVALQVIFRGRLDFDPLWVGLVLALVLVFVFNPLLKQMQRWVNRWIAGADRDPAELLRQYSQKITNILDLNLLASEAVNTASEFLQVRRGFLFLVDYEKGQEDGPEYQLRGVKGMGEDNPDTGRLRDGSPLAEYFRQERQPLIQAEIDFQPLFREAAAEERAWFASLGVEAYVPIFAKNEWIGLLALGPKGTGAAYTDKDLALLSMLADQTAIALENTRLVDGLLRLNNDFRRAYTALDQANRHLERLDRNKSDFISVASHELRTPLTIISGSSQMLLDEPEIHDNEYYNQLLSKIHNGTLRLHEIIDDMLSMAKIDASALDLETQPVSLDELIRTICGNLAKAAQERKQTVEIQDLKDLPPISADLTALEKVFHHLIINAIKYTPDGGKITISGQQLEPNLTDLPHGGVEIMVSDTGIGIDARFHELIFVKFYQTGELALHSSGKTKFKGGGPGLGLAIARGIVEAHNGKIWVESAGYDEEGCPGSQFHVVLPLRQMDSAQFARAMALLQWNSKTAP